MSISIRQHVAHSYPAVRLPIDGGVPVEVHLIAALDAGAGDRMIAAAMRRQAAHPAFVDALDEPSARLGGMHLDQGDATSVYSFAVGQRGHPFHRHAGHRMFTAVSGSAGAQLRFASPNEHLLQVQPAAEAASAFARTLHLINIPPDSLFTVRFGGGTWHQFVPLTGDAGHPALFAISCHSNELQGLPEGLQRDQVQRNAADIPALTELLPAALQACLNSQRIDLGQCPAHVLSFDSVERPSAKPAATNTADKPTSPQSAMGVMSHLPLAADSLLCEHLADADYQDSVQLLVQTPEVGTPDCAALMALLLEGFVCQPSPWVSWLMRLRNQLVRPLGLRRSPLGCPVSSLLAECSGPRFAGRFPVLAQHVDPTRGRVEVILGADDKHLAFRSCVGLKRVAPDTLQLSLSTRVRTRNTFGRIYMSLIDRLHRRLIAPTLLNHAWRYVQFRLDCRQ